MTEELPTLAIRYPDGREISVPLRSVPDGKDPAKFVWVVNHAVIELARAATNGGDELDLPCMVSSVVAAEHAQRRLTGAWRGMFEEAHRLLQDLGEQPSAKITKMLASLNAAETEEKEKISSLYKRFGNLIRHPGGMPFDSKKEG
jgi:hypothetical protein